MRATEEQAAALREQATQDVGGEMTVDRCEIIGQVSRPPGVRIDTVAATSQRARGVRQDGVAS